MSLPILTEQLPMLLADFPDISLVYLFGSQASGKVGPMSDVDLAIVEQPRHDETQARFSSVVAKLLGTDRVDVVLLSRASNLFANDLASILMHQTRKDLSFTQDNERTRPFAKFLVFFWFWVSESAKRSR